MAKQRTRMAGRRDDSAAAPRGSTVDDLIQRLTADIVERRLLPGVRLEEAGLAERFGVSRTPIREALRQLEIVGLVQRRPNRGVVVAAVSGEQLAAMFETLVELEAACARLAAQRMPIKDKKRLMHVHLKVLEVVPADDRSGFEAVNSDLHKLIWAGALNAELVALVVTLRQRLAPYRQSRLAADGRLSASFDEHARVVEAIVAGDANEAAEAMREHLRIAGETSWRFRF
jgi:DNA-binding GntR family transcriptional regulator